MASDNKTAVAVRGYTPGRWITQPTGPEWARQYTVRPEGEGWFAFGCRWVALVYDGERAEANARLIAAAPDLVEALREMTQYLDLLNLPAPNAGDLMIMEAHRLLARIDGE